MRTHRSVIRTQWGSSRLISSVNIKPRFLFRSSNPQQPIRALQLLQLQPRATPQRPSPRLPHHSIFRPRRLIADFCNKRMEEGGRRGPLAAPRSTHRDYPAEIDELLDGFHAAAARSDLEAYLACFVDQGRFLGTDATENWSVEELREYAAPAFEMGNGWRYTPSERRVAVGPGGAVVAVDEVLMSEKWGWARGTGTILLMPQRTEDGVMMGEQGGGGGGGGGGSKHEDSTQSYKLLQYHISFDVPNKVAAEVTALAAAAHHSSCP